MTRLSTHVSLCLPVSLSARLPCCLSVCILVCLSICLYVYLPVFLSHSRLFCHLPPCLILFYFAFHFQAENYGNFLVRFGPADKAACARLDAPDPPAAVAAHRKSERDRRRRDKPLGHKGSPTRGQWQFLSNCDSLESWRTAPDSAIATPQLSSALDSRLLGSAALTFATIGSNNNKCLAQCIIQQ